MKSTLTLFIVFFNTLIALAQNDPVISGDIMLCPESNGNASITNDETYDSYQWYFKYWFLQDDFEEIEGATDASFTYDWFTYDQALLKVVVTKNGETYESNQIQIDSYAFASLIIQNDSSENVEIDPTNGHFLICDGDYIQNTVQLPYTIVQWFKDGEIIEGATETSYTITEPGIYTVEASPESCPNLIETSLAIAVEEKLNCESSEVESPVIAGDIMLCPESNGTASITNNETYDSYQWYFKYWFLEDDFEAIEGATGASFTYDWFTYDQALLKVVVTKNGETYESNEIQVDSYAFASLLVVHNLSDGVEVDQTNGHFLICEDDYIESTVQMPYTIVQWFKDGEIIEGANETTYVFTEPGVYTVEASPEICSNFVETTPPMIVEEKEDCNLGVDEVLLKSIGLSQNPVINNLKLVNVDQIELTRLAVYDLSGKQVKLKSSGDLGELTITDLASGLYILRIQVGNSIKNIKFVKE